MELKGKSEKQERIMNTCINNIEINYNVSGFTYEFDTITMDYWLLQDKKLLNKGFDNAYAFLCGVKYILGRQMEEERNNTKST